MSNEIKKASFLDKKYEFDIKKLMGNSESYKSLIYGVVTVVVLFVVIILGLRSLSQNKAQIDNEAAVTQSTEVNSQDNLYTVSEGDSLWSIAEKSYNNGYAWQEIARANKITNPDVLEVGMKIVIPKITPTPVVKETSGQEAANTTMGQVMKTQEQVTGQKITGNSYNVVRGDYLWEIAIRAYGDGFRWVDIARANNLSNPDLIHSGNVLSLPRP